MMHAVCCNVVPAVRLLFYKLNIRCIHEIVVDTFNGAVINNLKNNVFKTHLFKGRFQFKCKMIVVVLVIFYKGGNIRIQCM